VWPLGATGASLTIRWWTEHFVVPGDLFERIVFGKSVLYETVFGTVRRNRSLAFPLSLWQPLFVLSVRCSFGGRNWLAAIMDTFAIANLDCLRLRRCSPVGSLAEVSCAGTPIRPLERNNVLSEVEVWLRSGVTCEGWSAWCCGTGCRSGLRVVVGTGWCFRLMVVGMMWCCIGR
jgi:hypothetical protein